MQVLERAIVVATLVVGRAGSAPDDPIPVRVPVGPTATDAGPAAPRSRIHARVVLDETGDPARGFLVALARDGWRGERESTIAYAAFDTPVEGGVGAFEWLVVAPGRDPSRGVVELREGERADLGVVRLVRGSAVVEGRVSGPDGRPVAGASLTLHGTIAPETANSEAAANPVQADENGRFRFERVGAGRGFLTALAPGLPAIAAVPVETTPGGRFWFDLLPEVGSITLRIRAPAGPWTAPFHLSLQDGAREVTSTWTIAPPGFASTVDPSGYAGREFG